MDIKKVLKEEVANISLSPEEIQVLKRKAEEIILILKKHKINASIGGSLAKNTLIKKQIQDIDIFAVFKNQQDTQKLEETIKKAGLIAKKVHGSRDYFHIQDQDSIFEIIPVVRFKDPAKAENVTDFSLLHVNYVAKKTKNHPKLTDEIKLAKVFCYSQNCYGAESYIKGFSGYALELLVINYGSFLNFLKNIVKLSKSKSKIMIDQEKKFKIKEQILTELNESKLQSPLVLIDPTYKFRNVTAGLSQETFNSFLLAASQFLKKPSSEFFKLKHVNPQELKNLAKNKKARFFHLCLKTSKQEGDIAATKMKKFFEFMIHELEHKKQQIIAKDFVYNKGQESEAYLVIKENKEIEIKGPPKNNEQALKNFKLVHKNLFFKKGFAFAKAKISLDDIFAKIKQYQEEMATNFEILS